MMDRLAFEWQSASERTGVHENPTERLIERLDTLCLECGHWLSFDVAGTKVLKVAAQSVREWIQECLFKKIIHYEETNFVVVHMGVDERYDKIKLEKCAYNEATFRVPDKDGWQPNQALIFDEDDLGHRLSTDIDVDRLAENLKNTYPIETSENAGRFASRVVNDANYKVN